MEYFMILSAELRESKGICMGGICLHPAINYTTHDFIQHIHPGMWEPHEETAIVSDGAPGPV